jgi:hypothetical protein
MSCSLSELDDVNWKRTTPYTILDLCW